MLVFGLFEEVMLVAGKDGPGLRMCVTTNRGSRKCFKRGDSNLL